MSGLYLTRHTDLIKNVPMDSTINIYGAGSIGSYTALTLAKLGFKNIAVFDNGFVDEENIAPQFYELHQVGMRKVEALKINIFKATGINILTYHGDLNQMFYTSKDSDNISYAALKVINNVGHTNIIFPADEEGDKKHGMSSSSLRNYTGGSREFISNEVLTGEITLNQSRGSATSAAVRKDIHILAVDSMELREKLFLYINGTNYGLVNKIIDARMAVKFLSVYCVSGTYESYMKTLCSDDEAVQEACTNKATSFTSMMAGSIIGKNVLDMLNTTSNSHYFIPDTHEVYSYVTHFDIQNMDIVTTKF